MSYNLLQIREFEFQRHQRMEFMRRQTRVNQNPQYNFRAPPAYSGRDGAFFQQLFPNSHAVGFSTPSATWTLNGASTYTNMPAARDLQGYKNFHPNEGPVGMPLGYRCISGVHGRSLNHPIAFSSAPQAAFDHSAFNFHSANGTATVFPPMPYRGDRFLSGTRADGLQNFEGVGHNISQHSSGEDMEYSEDNGVPDQLSVAGKDDSRSC